jgi:aspartate/methionine/tyrosine aminotransferase
MQLPPFLLDHWLNAHEFATPPIRHDLATSTGPAWTLGELLDLGGAAVMEEFEATRVSYAPPNGSLALRKRVAELHDVDPDWVVITTGASEALSALFCLLAERDAGVVLPHPGFSAIPVMARAWGLNVRTYELSPATHFQHFADRILDAVDHRTRLVLVNSPHNPTGAVMPPHDIAKLADVLAGRGVPLLVDEVYHPLYFGTSAPSAARLNNTIVVGDMSKALSLSGLRIGWLIEGDAVRRERLIDARRYFTISGSPITEAIATIALGARHKILARLESVARRNLELLDEFMHDQRKSIGWVRPAGGTVVFPWWLDGRDSRPFCKTLASAGVLMAPGDCFDAPAHFRLGFGARVSGFGEALEIAAKVIATQPNVEERSTRATG